jgi:PhoH-like ATPase
MSERKQKTFVIDTNVFIHRPDAVLSFRDSEIVIPLWVLEELDKLKSFSDERGRNARHAIRFLDGVGRKGKLSEGAKLENGSILRVSLDHANHVSADLQLDRNDNKIILAAYKLQQEGREVFFVSKDINARVKATALGLRAVDYEKQKVNIDDLYSGNVHQNMSQENIDALIEQGSLPWTDQAIANQYMVLHAGGDDSEQVLAKYSRARESIEYVDHKMPSVAGVRPLNEEQLMALDLLLDESIQLVSLVGKAGTGKTLLALAAGLRMTLEDKKYQRVLVSRPVVPMGKDIGYLPGAKNEKLSHWMQPLFDNLEFILNVYKKPNVKTPDQLINSKLIELEALSYIRGRSLPEQFIIIDEAQKPIAA